MRCENYEVALHCSPLLKEHMLYNDSSPRHRQCQPSCYSKCQVRWLCHRKLTVHCVSRYAFAAFATAEQCKAAHEKCQGAKIQGDSLVVLYAKKRSVEQKKKDAKSQQRKEQENESKLMVLYSQYIELAM